ncbi:unnamed protein product [Sphagnum troendelagicum]|uniref:ABC1 atypical kinase-like domain-containing protein n=1 Tax=Sphagnum troendelagicum TaxID=128251 RepID=A0ABP0TLA2_9BRYO
MSHLQDLAKVANGLALVVRESIRMGSTMGTRESTAAAQMLKSLAGTVTDLTGLTKGTIHNYYRDEEEAQLQQHQRQQKSIQEEEAGGPIGGSVHWTETSSASSRKSYLHRQLDSLSVMRSNNQEEPLVAADDEAVGNNTTETVSTIIGEASRPDSTVVRVPVKKRKTRVRNVPSTPFGRVMGFAGLGAGLAWGTFQESAKRLWGGQGTLAPGQSVLSPFLSEGNAERLALALCRMRGAALKVGQMLSIQDESLVPRPILDALERVRQGADVMPRRQLMKVISAELGPNWRDRLESFEEEPIASASIGQVHRAVTKSGKVVAMKVQYPGVANSIDSDIENVRRLLDYTNLIPEGLYLDQAIRVAKEELARECDYELEAANQKRFRELLGHEQGIYVPLVFDEFCSKRVLTTEFVPGISIDQVAHLEQKIRDRVGTQLLAITLKELFTFRFMQTDPNWGNFLYDEATDVINLIDFGAARGYPKHFVDDYLEMVLACANRDRAQVIEMSIRLGFLTGKESKVMLDAHTEAAFVVGLPFSRPGGFDFRTANLTQQVTQLGATMLQHRLTAPPDEAYSLHRKLSGAFLACVKMGSVVRCKEMFLAVYDNYDFTVKDKNLQAGTQ